MSENTDAGGGGGGPLSRPPFIIAGVVVLVIVLLGMVVVGIQIGRSGGGPAAQSSPPPDSAPPSTPAASAPSSSSAAPTQDPEGSLCGLQGTNEQVPKEAPAAAWDYEATFAYPTSPEFGPAETAPQGYRFCFQHSPTGAVFAAANAIANAADPSAAKKWADYFVSDGPNRDQVLKEQAVGDGSGSGVRMQIAGFKVLTYRGDTALVDIAVTISSSGRTTTGSFVYALVWQGGDWKLDSSAAEPFSFATVPDLSGYAGWGA